MPGALVTSTFPGAAAAIGLEGLPHARRVELERSSATWTVPIGETWTHHLSAPRRGGYVGRAPSVQWLNGKQGTELAEVIVQKIKSAVNAITFK